VEVGGAGNFLVAAAHLGLRAGALGSVGDDWYGRQVVAHLVAEGIDVAGLQLLPGAQTTLALVLIDDAGDHVFLGVLGTGGEVPLHGDWQTQVKRCRALYTNGYVFREATAPDDVLEAFELGSRAGIPTFFDPGPAISEIDPHWLKAMLERTMMLQLTHEEALMLVGSGSAGEVARALLQEGPEVVAVKLGAEGCLLVARQEEPFRVPGIAVPVRDTTGAGDAFDAACVYGYLHGFSLEQMGVFANAVGAATTTVVGAGTRIPDLAAVRRLLEDAPVAVSLL
jgi:sugar/nucleoside kinase (ribokinase family)